MLRVAVAGALGKMGRVACTALQEAADVTYVGGFARSPVPGDEIVDSLEHLFTRMPDVLIDVTTHPFSVEVSMQAIAHGVRPVIGASGWSKDERNMLDAMAR